MILRKLICLIIIITSNICFGQSNEQSYEQQVDSFYNLIENAKEDSIKVEHYYRLSLIQLYSEPLKGIQTAQKALTITQRLEDHYMTNVFYTSMLNTYLYYGAPADTLWKYIKLKEQITLTHLHEKDLVNTYWFYALYYANFQQLDKQLEYYLKALEVHRKHSDDASIEGALLGNIGGILQKQGKYFEALEYIKLSLRFGGDPIAQGVASHNIGLVYNKLEKYDTAFVYFERAYVLNKDGGDFQGVSAALVEQGKYYDRKGQFEYAKQLYFEALELINEKNIGMLRPYLFAAMASHHQLKGNPAMAINYAEQAVAQSKEQQMYDDLEDAYLVLEKSYADVKNFEKAYETRGAYMAFKDSVSNSDLLTKVEALRTEYEVGQTEAENKLLKAKATANEKTIQSRNITAVALLLGMLLMGSWAFVVFRTNQQKQKYNRQLEATVTERTAELQIANQNLKQAIYELRTFNYIASHDIKEPIRNVGNYAGLIFKKLPNDLQQSLSSYFDTIKRSTSQLYTLVEDFAKYTTLSRDEDVEKNPTDLNALVYNLENAMETTIKKYNGKVINNGLPTIASNSSLLYTTLKNLIENGLKYNESTTPTVELSYNETATHHEIIISDNGIGISAAYQDKIFEMFKRLHNRGEYEGTGIGLAIVKLAMDKLGGQVRVESEIGKGARFVLSLPVV